MTKVPTGNPLPRLAEALQAMRKLQIIIDHLPYAELSPNAREHWMVKSQMVRASREEIGWLAKSQWHDDKPVMRARISYEFHVKDKYYRDLDNLFAMCKPWQDGLVDAGVLFSDNAQHLVIGTIRVIQGDIEQSIITVEEILK